MSDRKGWMAAGALLVALTGLLNNGYLGLDEFFEGIKVVVPAESQLSLGQLVWAKDGAFLPHPPLGRALRAVVPRVVAAVGIEDPWLQLRCTLAALGLFAFFGCVLFLPWCFRETPPTAESTAKELWIVGLSGFYFLCPLVFSRPMEEAMVIPFIAAALGCACRYVATHQRRFLLGALVATTLAAHVRFQAGLLWPALAITVLAQRRWKDMALFGAVSVGLFVLGGLVEWNATGEPYGLLRANLEYNRHAGERHGRQGWWVFPLLAFAATIPPTLFARYRGFSVRAQYERLAPVLAFFVIFLGAHSVVPHKEERFLLPLLPAILVLLVPLLVHLATHGPRWRAYSFASLNVFFLLVVITSVPQQSLLGLAGYVQRLGIPPRLIDYDGSLHLFPTNLLLLRPTVERAPAPDPLARLLERPRHCGDAAAIRDDQLRDGHLPEDRRFTERYVRVARFETSWIERFVLWTNPGPNRRRSAVNLYQQRGCPPLPRFGLPRESSPETRAPSPTPRT